MASFVFKKNFNSPTFNQFGLSVWIWRNLQHVRPDAPRLLTMPSVTAPVCAVNRLKKAVSPLPN